MLSVAVMATRRPTPNQRELPSAFLKAWLDHLKVRQNELARRIGVSAPTVSKYVSGKSGIDMGTAIAIAEALEISDADIFGFPPKKGEERTESADEMLRPLSPAARKRALRALRSYIEAELSDDSG
ncbi:MAG: hypothetical protein AcusKO_29540 [Acuticoccus sp.]